MKRRGAPVDAGRAMVRGTSLITVFAVIAGLLRLGQDVAIAWRLGSGPEVDAYTLLQGFAQWPAVVALSTLSALAGPAEAGLRHDPAAVLRFRAELFHAVLLTGLVVVPLVGVAMALAALHAPVPAVAAAAWEGLPAMLLVAMLGLPAALVSAWWVADSRHALTLAESSMPALMLAGVLLLPAGWLFAIAAGAAATQLAVLAGGLVRRGMLPVPMRGRISPAWRGLGCGAVALVAGQMLFALTPLVDLMYGARLGEGQLAALGYANRLLLGLLGLLGLALQRAGMPLLTALVTEDGVGAGRLARRWALRAAAGGALLGLLLAMLAEPAVQLLFERGRFGATERAQVVPLLRAGAWQVAPYLGGLVLMTALAAARATGTIAALAAIGLALKLAATALLVPWMGSAALPLGTAIVYASTALLAAACLRRVGARLIPRGSD